MEKTKQKQQISEQILAAVRKKAENNRLSCTKARALAKELSISVQEVGAAANQQGIKIVACELGCF